MKIIPRRFNKHDIEERVIWINNSKINSNMFFNTPATVQDTEIWYDINVGSSVRIDFTFTNEMGSIIAMGGFTTISIEHKNAEFYVMVHPEMHGEGIGKLTSFWMYNYGFSKLDLHKIYLYTNDDNISAYKIYEKAGFTLEGIQRDQKWKNERFQNRRLYGLLQTEWENLDWKKCVVDEI